MGIAWWVPKATDTHSEYVILIAFPLQKWLQEAATILRFTCTAWLVHSCCAVNALLQNTGSEQNFNNF
jgi:hypothetical protein